MSEEEIIQEIRDNITDNEGKYMLCDALEDIIKNNNKKYDIQIIVSGLLDLYNKEKEQNKININSINDLMKECNEENKRCSELAIELQAEKEKNKALKEGLKYRINYCKLLEKELYANGVNYEFEKTEIEKQLLEE